MCEVQVVVTVGVLLVAIAAIGTAWGTGWAAGGDSGEARMKRQLQIEAVAHGVAEFVPGKGDPEFRWLAPEVKT